MIKTAFLTIAIATCALSVSAGEFTDPRDGQTYKTITVGEHTWMAENLNYDAMGSWCWEQRNRQTG